MAKKESKAEVSTQESIIGNVTRVDDGHGGTILVPVGAVENRTANQLLASQMRHMLQQHIKTFREKEITMTPKELRDLAETAKTIAEFSGAVYAAASSEIPGKPEMKTAIPTEKPADDVNFDDLTKPVAAQ